MRSEEVQLIGAVEGQKDSAAETGYIFPGTHFKHIYVQRKQVTDFKTYMTGEYFELLSQKNILRESVEKNRICKVSVACKVFSKAFRML